MNIPNKLTVLRVILVPIFMALYLIPSHVAFSIFSFEVTYGRLLAVIIFILASVTDWADGHIARKNGLVTNFGKFMDPLADKLLITGALCCLLSDGTVNVVIVMIILAREFIVTGLRLVAASEGIVIAAGMLGKIKTTIQMITVIAAVIFGKNLAVDILFWISAFITALSGVQYIIDNRKVFENQD